jgi:S-adenosylmethionine:tRNA ribosyltransferase-isomerase
MTSLFHFDLPPHLIAQHPVEKRDQSRLMVLDRDKHSIRHQHFADLPRLLNPGDLLVLNNSRVLPARLYGHRAKTGGQWEGLFLRETPDGLWELMAQSGGKPQIGESIIIEENAFELILRGRNDRYWLAEPKPHGSPVERLTRFGQIPLPPYIRKGVSQATDQERYQTVFAEKAGSVAAPTAGLHFTPQLLNQLREKGINTTSITLHVGLGTFEPVRTEDPSKHEQIRSCKANGGRVIAVGTTSTRALESAAQSGTFSPFRGETKIYIYPPYDFRVIDGLITNFHLPQTTLLLLVGALAGMTFLEEAYRTAIQEEYRFFSYGDAMLIL